MPRNIAALTPHVVAPGYVSINEDSDGAVAVTVRAAAEPDGSLGASLTLVLTADEWADLRQQIIAAG